MNTARCLLAEANVERKFWLECIMTAAYLLNRSLINKSRNKTPYEIFFGKKPSAKNLRLHDSRVFVRVSEDKRSSKWKRKAELGTLLGYSDVGYRVLIKNKVIVARYVDILEEDMKCIGFKDKDEIDEVVEEDETAEVEAEEKFKNIKENTENTNNEEECELRRSGRVKKTPPGTTLQIVAA